ncbi:Anaerobic sulfatase-maturating enzyme [Raoultella terrigena]|uniref:Anaerobic sulfatase-maturating enzyme n=1 Tax=Raoultella terrigena TaxID=577 RepID=A0A4U9D6N5_RAOTE|nr:Anaerobic sulfatase-maturating enzyme [Raoultella terrigena]
MRCWKTLFASIFQSQDGEEIIFSWQGGEPTLMGLEFFEKVVALQKKYQPKHQRIENDLQTNAC